MSGQRAFSFEAVPEMSVVELRVWRTLRLHEGAARAIQARDLAALVGTTTRNVQRAIHALIHTHGKPIGSSMSEPFGYFHAVTREDREEAARLHRSRALAMLATAAKIVGVTVEEEVARFQTKLDLA